MKFYNGEPEDSKIIDIIFKWIVDIVIVLVLALFVYMYCCQQTKVQGNSMNDMLKNEDQVLVNTIAYNILPVARYDVISFHKGMEDGEKIQYVKRVIGLPGETILIKDGEFYVNGKKLDYKKSKDKIVNAGLATEEIKLKDDEYFVIGDNINNSEDSRSATVGNVKKTEIDGKVWLISWPFANINLVK